MHGDAGDLTVDNFALPGVEAYADVESQPLDRIGDRASTADSPGRPVESGEESVAGGVDLPAAGAGQLAPDQRVVLLEQLSPRRVADLDRSNRGVDDVAEKDGAENPFEPALG